MFLFIVTYTAPLSAIDAALEAHRAWLEEGFAKGVLLLCGPQVPREGGAILAHGLSRAEAEALAATDPFVLRGVANYRIIEMTPRRADPRLEFLIS